MEITGRVALVTGASSGIGRATALALARAGAALTLVDVDEDGGRETARQVEALGGEALFVRADVSLPADTERMFAEAERRFGGVDIVHNNAGIMTGDAPGWPDAPLAKLAQVIAVNLGGVVLGTRAAVDALRRRGGGAVVNTASIAGLGLLPNDPVYSSSKAGVIHFTKCCAALAESDGIRVNAVVPGMVDTPIINKTGDGTKPPDWLRPFLEATPLLPPERIADEVLALLRDDALAGETRVVVPDEGRPLPRSTRPERGLP